MRSTFSSRFLLPILFSSVCLAQHWEVGALGGFGFYHNATITNPIGTAQIGYEPRFAVGALLDQNMYNYISGEIRYMFLVGNPGLKFGGTQATTDGYSNIIHYDVLFHGRPVESKVRPYFAVGGGVKIYSSTQRRFLDQPLLNFASLSPVNEAEPMLSLGAGLKYSIVKNVQLRFDFHTYLTPAPNNLFRPTFPSTIHGWVYNFIPMLGVSYIF